MISRGMLFSGPMARANKAGKKTETRRAASNATVKRLRKALQKSERVFLYQRENFRLERNFDPLNPGAIKGLNFTQMPVWYEADAGAPAPRTRSEWGHEFGFLRTGIHMPKWASRLAMEIGSIREEQLGDITDEAALAEGIDKFTLRGETRYGIIGRYDTPSESADGWEWDDFQDDPRRAWFRLFAMVNGLKSDSFVDMAQPVFVIRYTVSERNILELEKQFAPKDDKATAKAAGKEAA